MPTSTAAATARGGQGYDCSGSVSYALHGGGLLGSPARPAAFMSWGAPARAATSRSTPTPGHVFMVVNGRRFDTTAPPETGSRWQGHRALLDGLQWSVTRTAC